MLPRVLLADDHPAVLNRVASLLESTCEIVGKVVDGRALLEASTNLHPEILVVDISMPVMSGIEVAQQLKKSGDKAKIVFLTVHEDPDFVQAAMAAGACGYVIKSRLATDLLSAIRAALLGQCFISPPLSPKDSAPVA